MSAQCRSCGAEGGIPQKLRPKGSRAFQLSGEFCWHRAWCKTKASLCSAFQMEMSTRLSTQARPSNATEVGLVALGQLEPERAGKASRQGSQHIKPWTAPALNRHVTVLNVGLLSLSSARSPEQRYWVSSPLRDGSAPAAPPAALRLGTLGEDSAVAVWWAWESDPGPFLTLPLPGCVVLGMSVSC